MRVSQKIISLILVLTMAMGLATTPSFAAVPDTQSSGSSSWYVPWQNTSHSIYTGESIGDILRYFAQWNDLGLSALYQRMGGLSSDIQSVVTAIGNIPGATDYSTILNSIDSKIVDYTNNFASVENKLQSIINNLINVNTGISSINTSIGTGSVNNNILSNLSDIITGQSNIKVDTGNIKTDTSSIKTILSRKYYNTIYNPSLWSTGNAAVTQFATPRIISWLTNSDNTNLRMGFSSTATIDNPLDYLAYMNSNLVNLSLLFRQSSKYYNVDKFDYENNTFSEQGIVSLFDWFEFGFNPMNQVIHKLGYVLADDDTIAAKQANKPQSDAVLNDFTGSGDASASVNDFAGVKDSVSALKTSLSGGASYTQAFNILSGNSDGWSWFTNEVAESMDSTGNGNSRLRSVPDSTPYLDSYYSELSSYLGYSYNGGIE